MSEPRKEKREEWKERGIPCGPGRRLHELPQLGNFLVCLKINTPAKAGTKNKGTGANTLVVGVEPNSFPAAYEKELVSPSSSMCSSSDLRSRSHIPTSEKEKMERMIC